MKVNDVCSQFCIYLLQKAHEWTKDGLNLLCNDVVVIIADYESVALVLHETSVAFFENAMPQKHHNSYEIV